MSEPSSPEPAAPKPSAPRSTTSQVGRWSALRRVVLYGLLWVVAIVVPAGVRVGWEGHQALQQAQDAAAAGDSDLQVEYLGRAARWRLPWVPHDAEALTQLEDVGRGALAEERPVLALAAFRELRRAILATRSWGVHRPALLWRANHNIATLMADQERVQRTAGNIAFASNAEAYAFHLEALEDTPGPDPVRANLAAWCFLLWLVTLAGFVLRAIDARGRLDRRRGARWGIACLLAMLGWLSLLALA